MDDDVNMPEDPVLPDELVAACGHDWMPKAVRAGGGLALELTCLWCGAFAYEPCNRDRLGAVA